MPKSTTRAPSEMDRGSNDWDLDALVRSCGGGGLAFDVIPCSEAYQVGGGGGAVAASVDQFELVGQPVGRAASSPSLYELEYLDLVHEMPRAPFSITAASRGRERVDELLMSFPDASTSGQVLPTRRQPGRKPAVGAAKRPKRSKNKKSQLKKVVREVAVGDGGGVSGTDFDQWAWRKYGQKPIKGSPYPRGYYKCSSLKACKARKLVERSQDKPGVLVVTYIADHCHSVPTQLNALAGTARQSPQSTGSDEAATAAAAATCEDNVDTPSVGADKAPDEGDDLWTPVEMDLDYFFGSFDEDFDHFLEGGGDLLGRRVSL